MQIFLRAANSFHWLIRRAKDYWAKKTADSRVESQPEFPVLPRVGHEARQPMV